MDTLNNELIPKQSWWKRNWKWAVPVGGCFTLIALFVVLVVAGIFGVTKMFTGSELYAFALESTQNNARVVALLGEPIEISGIMQGNINFSNDDGNADFNIPIKGPKGVGKIYVVADKNNGTWTYTELEVGIEKSNEVINLLQGTAADGLESI